MLTKNFVPDYIFEASWEVCNKVGGIYTVLSTRAKTLQDAMKDRLYFIGPDIWKDKENPLFLEDDTLYTVWRNSISQQGLNVRTGRWNIPGKPIVFLVDSTPLYNNKNDIYRQFWEDFGVDSLHGYGDYDEASMFSYSAGLVVESYYKFYLSTRDKVVFHAHEWMTGLGALYIHKHVPTIGTIFTTHATSIGRSIAGNGKPLYDYLFAYNGDQMAEELNVQSKHSVEKQTAMNVDCFTTVSDVTAHECKELLDKDVDVVLMNGFEDDFVPSSTMFSTKRAHAREVMLKVANCLTGQTFDDQNTLIVGTSGRYEYKNKGIDVFLESMNRLQRKKHINKDVLAFIMVPGWVGEARSDLRERLKSGKTFNTPLQVPLITHWLHDMSHDQVLDMLKYNDMHNRPEDKVKIIFIPCYLDGNDGIVNLQYYDFIIGKDVSIYPSYYEPWGYTPLESIAFKVPCITTDLSGFGQWVNKMKGAQSKIADGVEVLHRTDYNYSEVCDNIRDILSAYTFLEQNEVDHIREHAGEIAEKALWKHFITYYYKAYQIALQKVAGRNAPTRPQKKAKKA
jgi:glycosyltransferase involved in cell wall biosynthesis